MCPLLGVDPQGEWWAAAVRHPNGDFIAHTSQLSFATTILEVAGVWIDREDRGAAVALIVIHQGPLPMI